MYLRIAHGRGWALAGPGLRVRSGAPCLPPHRSPIALPMPSAPPWRTSGEAITPRFCPLGEPARPDRAPASSTPQDPLHPRCAKKQPLRPQKGRNAAVSVTSVLAGHPDDPLHELRLVVGNACLPTLRVPRLPKHPACPAFGHHVTAERVTYMLDRLAPLRRAQKFATPTCGLPEAASRRIALSSSASARSRFNRAFSFSRSFSRFAWSVRRPPYSRFHR